MEKNSNTQTSVKQDSKQFSLLDSPMPQVTDGGYDSPDQDEAFLRRLETMSSLCNTEDGIRDFARVLLEAADAGIMIPIVKIWHRGKNCQYPALEKPITPWTKDNFRTFFYCCFTTPDDASLFANGICAQGYKAAPAWAPLAHIVGAVMFLSANLLGLVFNTTDPFRAVMITKSILYSPDTGNTVMALEARKKHQEHMLKNKLCAADGFTLCDAMSEATPDLLSEITAVQAMLNSPGSCQDDDQDIPASFIRAVEKSLSDPVKLRLLKQTLLNEVTNGAGKHLADALEQKTLNRLRSMDPKAATKFISKIFKPKSLHYDVRKFCQFIDMTFPDTPTAGNAPGKE
mgnify:CR=1 FL=1